MKVGAHLAVGELVLLLQAARAWDPAVPVGSAGPFDGEAYRPAYGLRGSPDLLEYSENVDSIRRNLRTSPQS